MRHIVSVSLLVSLLLLPTACSDEPADSAGDDRAATSPSPSVSTTDDESAAPSGTPLEGVWETEITEEAYRAAVVEAGFTPQVAAELAEIRLPGPEFRLEFLGDRFRMSFAPIDEQFQSGTFTLEGDQIVLDDEAPVGTYNFVVTLNGDTVTFSDGGATNPEIESSPGVPDYLTGVGFWSADTWTKES